MLTQDMKTGRNMVTINIDGKSYEVEEGQNLLEASQALGLEIPYFCWHPAMGSVGSCRQCAVTIYHDEEDTRGRIVMSCMTPVMEGQRLSIVDPKVKKFRSLLIEATMTNHPHDCPVCEEGGECHLQDMTLMSGHTERRYKGPKRTHNNQYLGPFINHEMNRCIGCYRCVRFYRDYSGGTDLNVFASRNNIYFGRAEEGVLENEFSGNLAEVCPTGVFTDKSFSQHFSRKWDLQCSPSVCVHCSVGCNIHPAERHGTLRRITNRFNPDINGHFLCDRGRFGYEFVNNTKRTTHPWQRNYSQRTTDKLTNKEALQALQQNFNHAKNDSVIAIGSSRSSLENNFSLRELVGKNNFYSDSNEQESNQLVQLTEHYHHTPNSASLKQLEAADVTLLVGEDVTQTAPRIALSLRQMVKNAGKTKAAQIGVQIWSAAEVKNITQDLKSPLHIIGSHSTRLDDIATTTTRLFPTKQIELIHKITLFLNKNGTNNDSKSDDSPSNDIDQKAKIIANDLKSAKAPCIVSGINANCEALLEATLTLNQTLYEINNQSGFVCALPQANSFGLSLLTTPKQHLDTVLEKLAQAPPETLIILETDLYRCCESEKLEALLNNVKNIVVLDHLLTPTGEQADLLLPTTSFAEYHGSWINYEGRLQAAVSCFPPENDRQPAHQWLTSGTDFHSLINDLAGVLDGFADLPTLFSEQNNGFPVARKTIRASGRTAINAAIEVRELPPKQDNDSPYQYSQEGISSLVNDSSPPTYFWSPGWNSNEAVGHFQQKVNGPIRGTHPGILLFSTRSNDETSHTSTTPFALEEPPIIPENAIRILPYHHIFADEELSGYVSSIQRQAPEPCIKLNTQQAKVMGFTQDCKIIIHCTDIESADTEKTEKNHRLPLTIDDSVPNGTALISAPLLRKIQLRAGSIAYLENAHD